MNMEKCQSPQNKNVKRQDMYKCRTPPWKDTYRQRCKDKLKENREKVMALRRSIQTDAESCDVELQHKDIKDIMAEEWAHMKKEMETGLNSDWNLIENIGVGETYIHDMESLFDQIQEELKMEEQQLLSMCDEHLNREEEELCDSLQSLTTISVICPICERNTLMEHKGVIVCRCGLRINTEQDCINLKNIKKNLDFAANDHSESCDSKPVFELVDKFGITTLIMSCSDCDFMFIIV